LQRELEQAHSDFCQNDEVIKGLQMKLGVQKICTDDVKLRDAAVIHDDAKGNNLAYMSKVNLEQSNSEDWETEEQKDK
jgi:hypothetical protein